MRHSLLRTALLPLALLTAAPALASPFSWLGSGKKGDGQLKTEERKLPAFQKVDLRTSVDVVITEGPTPSTRVTVDGNLQPLLTTRVEGDTLVIDTEGNGIDESRGSKVELVMPALAAVNIHGSGDVKVQRSTPADALELGVEGSGDLAYRGSAKSISARIQGSGDITLDGGKAERLEAGIHGSGDLKARGLSARDASVAIHGSGDAAITADGGTLAFEIHGSGDVTWYGEGKVERTSIHGSGDVTHRQ